MNYGYLRTSTSSQDAELQKYEVLKFADEKHFVISEWVSETVSGAKPYKQRALGPLLNKLQPGDCLIVTEISRLGRSLMEVMEILNLCISKKTVIYTTKERFVLEDGLHSKIMMFCFGLAGEVEKQLIGQRTREALAKKKSEGKHLGRPKGSLSKSKLTGKEDMIKELLGKRVSKASISKILEVHPGTLDSFIKTRKLTVPLSNNQQNQKG